MKKYFLVAGGRTFTDKKRLEEIINESIARDSMFDEIVIVEGGAKGVDTMAREYAESRGLEVLEFKADWKKYGRAAGPKRNDEMTAFIAEHNGKAIFIWDGESKGTKQCIASAMNREISTRVFFYTGGGK